MYRVTIEPPKVKSNTLKKLLDDSGSLKKVRPQEIWRVSSKPMYLKSKEALIQNAQRLGIFALRDKTQMMRLIDSCSYAIARQARTRVDIIVIAALDEIFSRTEKKTELTAEQTSKRIAVAARQVVSR